MALTRSQQMARIKGRNTRPEILLRQALWARGLRYRLHAKTSVGRPDVVFPGRRVAVFIDGCQWHGCPDHYVRPRTRTDYWSQRLRVNVERDRRQTLALEAEGWQVVRCWEHTVRADLDVAAGRVEAAVRERGGDRAAEWRVIEVEVLSEDGNEEARHLTELRGLEADRIERRRRTTAKGWR